MARVKQRVQAYVPGPSLSVMEGKDSVTLSLNVSLSREEARELGADLIARAGSGQKMVSLFATGDEIAEL